MSFLETFLTSIGGTAIVLAAAWWLLKSLIFTRLQKAVAHEFNSKLENLRSELRGKEAEIASIRDTAASLSAGRGRAADERRLRAIDELWEGFLAARKHSWAVKMIQVIKLDAVAEKIEDEPKLQGFFRDLVPSHLVDQSWSHTGAADMARPWVSELAWAYFSAYLSIVGYSNLWMEAAKRGLNPEKVVGREGLNRLLATAIPDMNFEAEKDYSGAFGSLSELLESKLLSELRRQISGEDLDARDIERARKIAEASKSVDDVIKAAGGRLTEAQTEART